MSTLEEINKIINSGKKIKYCANPECQNEASCGYTCPTHCANCKLPGMYDPTMAGACIGKVCKGNNKGPTDANYGKIVNDGERRIKIYCKICLMIDIGEYSYISSSKRVCCECGKMAQYFKGDDAKTMFCGNHIPLPEGYEKIALGGTCSYKGCDSISANYGPKGSKVCSKHVENKFNTSNICIIRGCVKEGKAGPNGKKWFCSKHRTSDSIISVQTCSECTNPAKYGFFEDKVKIYCKDHRDPQKHVNLAKQFCTEKDCRKTALFSGPDDDGPKRCGSHKTENMIYRYGYKCEICEKPAIYNLPGQRPRYCVNHKSDKMINVRTIKCSCDVVPSYGFEVDGKIVCCKNCKIEGMVNLSKKKCEVEKCEYKPTYGHVKGEPLRCKTHGLEAGMKRVSIVCEIEGCNNFGTYGDIVNGDRRCLTHKLETDINTHHPRCAKCGSLKYYGIPGSDISSCVECKTSGMIKYSKKSCQQCTNPATHGWRTGVQLYCKLHAPENVPDLTEYECIECGKVLPIDSDSKCHICSGSKKMRIQEIVKDYLDKNEIKYTSYDQPIGSVKYRPDFYFNCGSVKIIVEVDENQHKDYKNDKERMIEIHENIKCDGICFVRFNPDPYFSGGMKRDPNLDIRLRELKKVIGILLDDPKRIVGPVVVYLYYDGMKDDLQPEKITNH